VWQWVRRGTFPRERAEAILEEEAAKLRAAGLPRIDDAVRIFREVALSESFPDFLTLPAYEILN